MDGLKKASDRGLSKRERLLKRNDFLRVQRLGVRFQTRHFIVLTADGPGLGHHRLGITAGRRAGGAVRRNRIKRLIREYFRLNKADILEDRVREGVDIVVILRPGCPNMKLDDVSRELEACLQK